jgi:predicted amidohydrolase YtcJ
MVDLIIHNGSLIAQDTRFAQATSLAIRNGRIIAVGRESEIAPLATASTERIDAQGCSVLPGITDAHFHYYDWALALRQLPLEQTGSLAGMRKLVQEAAGRGGVDEWIVGRGWNETNWSEGRVPTRADLDDVAPVTPALLFRNDMHLAVVNSAALTAAHITAETPDPAGGLIQRDPHGRPTGVLCDLAMNLVSAAMPAPKEAETVAAMRDAQAILHRLGVTGVHDFRVMGGICGKPALRAWQQMHQSGELRLRAWVNLPGEALEELLAVGIRTGFGDDWLRMGHVKFFVDGSQGARSAWMLEPYEDGGVGFAITPLAELAHAVRAANRAGLAVAIHAIGDRANRELLDLFEALHRQPTGGDAPAAPNRIEHVQLIDATDVARFAGSRAVASVQPLQVTDDIPMVEASVGRRAARAYNFQSLLSGGATLALGSDCPVANPNPWWGIHAAVTRQRRDGTPDGGWYPQERLTLPQAIAGYTLGPAYATGRLNDLGSLAPGKLADVVILDRDLRSIPAGEIARTTVRHTIIGGEVVYRG